MPWHKTKRKLNGTTRQSSKKEIKSECCSTFLHGERETENETAKEGKCINIIHLAKYSGIKFYNQNCKILLPLNRLY